MTDSASAAALERDVARPLTLLIEAAIEANGGWLPFDRYMALALYAPGLGYYASGRRTFGLLPQTGSDFVTAPELSPLFGAALARQVGQALEACATDEVWEFGAGSGELAAQLLDALGPAVARYTIVDVSGALRSRQRERLAAYAGKVEWADTLPATLQGVVVGNEVLDAMPVQLLAFDGEHWLERGVVARQGHFEWSDRPTTLRPPGDDDRGVDAAANPDGDADADSIRNSDQANDEVDDDAEHNGRDKDKRKEGDDIGGAHAAGTLTELHRQAEAFVATLAERMTRGAAFFIDYGFPQAEYRHPQRSGGTLMCHRGHRADTDPLVDVGAKDITAHVDFTAIAVAAQDAGFEVIGYTSQARFLMNCGLLDLLAGADLRTLAHTQKLLTEHEMGELFKVLALAKGCAFEPLGFAQGDRRHRL